MSVERILVLYIKDKLFEWVMTLAMVLLGAGVIAYPAALEQSAFQFMIFIPDARAFGGLCLFFGIARLIALVVNGRSHRRGPMVRALCSIFASVFWFQMFAALVAYSFVTGFPSPGIYNWFSLIVGELAATYLAGRDVGRST